MDASVKAFLNSHRVSVLGILQKDNIIHSATLHFAYREDPFSFYFITEKESKKCRSLLLGKEVSSSLVIGFDEEEFATFQAEGAVMIISDELGLKKGWEVYGEKFHDRSGQKANPDMVLLRFVPDWWRFSDLKNNIYVGSEEYPSYH